MVVSYILPGFLPSTIRSRHLKRIVKQEQKKLKATFRNHDVMICVKNQRTERTGRWKEIPSTSRVRQKEIVEKSNKGRFDIASQGAKTLSQVHTLQIP